MIDGLGRGALPRVVTPASEPSRRAPVSEPAVGQAAVPAKLGGVVREMAASPPVDGARVAALRTAIASGRYQPDPEAIAARMLAFGAK